MSVSTLSLLSAVPARVLRGVLLLMVVPAAAAPLSFEQALALASQGAPTLAAAQARLDAASAAIAPAGELPDPKIAVGLDNYPVGGPERWAFSADFMTMQRIAVSQDVPNRSKRAARVAVAQARAGQAAAAQRLARLALRRETALAWIRRHAIEAQLALFDSLSSENSLLAASIEAQLASGRSSAADALAPRQEAALLADRRDELLAQREQAVAALQRWLGDAGAQPLAGDPPDWPLDRAALTHRVHAHAELAALDDTGRLLDAEVREAIAMKQPDWGVEVAYQHRAHQFGDMVSVQFSFDLPVFAERRQDPQIAARQAERLGLAAERDALEREHVQQLNEAWAELERLDRALARNRQTLQPLARERVELSLAAYGGGRGSLADHLAARREALELRLQALALQGERAAMAARLHFGYDEASEGEQP